MTLLGLFGVGFVMGLTGAMMPGPLLTITVSASVKRGGLVGPFIVLGHGLLELALLFGIVFGLGRILNNRVVFTAIAFGGGLLLIRMGCKAIKGLKQYSLAGGEIDREWESHPVWAGIFVSLSNPYWLIWWVTIGMGYVMFAGKSGLAGITSFFAGHILSDFIWYSLVSYGMHFGGTRMNVGVIKAILFFCSLFLIGFGAFFVFQGFRFLRSLSF